MSNTQMTIQSARSGFWLPLAVVLISALVVIPVVAIIWIALTGTDSNWSHLIDNVLPRATGRTLTLLLATSVVSTVTGIVTAWLVVTCDFPGRRFLASALILPLAMPTYIAAYAFGEFLDFTGPLQSLIRLVFGFTSVKQYWFPEIRSTGGAVFVMSAVLYPYIYLTCLSVFMMQGRAAADVARTLGAGPLSVFFKIQVPMARPAIIVGLTLVMMETLNDIGAVEYLGVPTLTFSIYDTWLNRGSLSGAAGLACVLLVFVALLAFVERHARRRQRFSGSRTTSAVKDMRRIPLKGWRAAVACMVCLLPVLAGFGIPVAVMGVYAARRLDHLFSEALLTALINSVAVSAAVAVIAVVLAFVIAYGQRIGGSKLISVSSRIAVFGYGVPGTILAIGVLVPLAFVDNQLDAVMRDLTGYSTGLLLSGTVVAIIYACTVRFLTSAQGTIEAGFHKLSPHMDMAARTLGRTRMQTLKTVLLPMMRPAALTAGLVVFIDTMKELSATILLRPFGFSTLATLVYEDASRAKVEDASIPALIIILAGLVPVILVARSIQKPANG